MDKNLPYYLGFSYCLGIGPMRFKLLLDTFKTVEKAYQATDTEIKETLDTKTATDFIAFRKIFRPDKTLQELFNKSIQVITLEHALYPSQLASISDPPICLYVKGNADILADSRECFFAIVGTRKATSYGLHVGKMFARDLALSGLTIVSGMALGIDSAAHRGALEAKGKTIAILGCGVDIIYPPTNRTLYETIIASGGAIISEFPAGHTVLPGLFVARNRIISALSRGVLVVEGEAQSGALITARYAAEQGRDVFAPPVPITSTMSQAPNILLKEGATLATCVEDILDTYDMKKKSGSKPKIPENLDSFSKTIIEKIIEEPQTADDLCRLLNSKMTALLNSVSLLELRGIIEKNNEGKFAMKS